MMVPTLPVPFYILCGSLGAGKTTLLTRLLEYWNTQGHRVGVLMNEAGEVSIDGPRVGAIAEQVMNLAGGCVCCDTKEDLSWGIAQLVGGRRRREYEREQGEAERHAKAGAEHAAQQKCRHLSPPHDLAFQLRTQPNVGWGER